MKLHNLSFVQNNNDIIISCLVNNKKLFYSLPLEYKNYIVTESYDAFLLQCSLLQ